jgi:hypothetical protein
MGKLQSEYIIIIDTKDGFCNSASSFNSLLRSYDNIDIREDHLTFSGTQFGYEVQTGEIGQEGLRFFHVRIVADSVDQIDEFSNLLRLVRTILHKVGKVPPQSLWDGVSFYYAQKSYPLIYEIENLMRKLIVKFMLTTVGIQWAKEAIPEDVKRSIRTEARTEADYLYAVDFVQLSNILFSEYSTMDFSQLLERIRVAESISELDLKELKQFVPRSNWERYFSPIIDCESGYLEKRWKQLYKLRCQVAHSRLLTKAEYQHLCSLFDAVRGKLHEALDKLDQVCIADEELELVAENIVGNLNTAYGEFLSRWKELVELLQELVSISAPGERNQLEYYGYLGSPSALIRTLSKKNVLDKQVCQQLKEFLEFRNALVHGTGVKIPEETVLLFANRVKRQVDEILSMLPDAVLMELADTGDGYDI